MSRQDSSPEFSRPLALRDIEADGVNRPVEATQAERAALAERFGLLAIEELRAELAIRRLRERGVVTVQGRLRARVIQACVVTLDPVKSSIEQPIDERFSLRKIIDGQEILASDDNDFDEPLEGDLLDLGEIVAQCLSLALDPYPRKDGATLEMRGPDSVASAPDGPFAELAKLKRDRT